MEYQSIASNRNPESTPTMLANNHYFTSMRNRVISPLSALRQVPLPNSSWFHSTSAIPGNLWHNSRLGPFSAEGALPMAYYPGWMPSSAEGALTTPYLYFPCGLPDPGGVEAQAKAWFHSTSAIPGNLWHNSRLGPFSAEGALPMAYYPAWMPSSAEGALTTPYRYFPCGLPNPGGVEAQAKEPCYGYEAKAPCYSYEAKAQVPEAKAKIPAAKAEAPYPGDESKAEVSYPGDEAKVSRKERLQQMGKCQFLFNNIPEDVPHGPWDCADLVLRLHFTQDKVKQEVIHFNPKCKPFHLEWPQCLLRIEWVRIKDIKRETTHRRAHYPEVFPFCDDSNQIDPEMREFVGSQSSSPSFNSRDWYVYGNIDVHVLSDENSAFKSDHPEQGPYWESLADMPGNTLRLTGPSVPIIGDYNENEIELHLKALHIGDDGKISLSQEPLEVADGSIDIIVYNRPDHSYYAVEEVTGANGSVSVCYSLIYPGIHAVFSAVLSPNKWPSNQAFDVYGSISIKIPDTDWSVDTYIFHSSRDACVLMEKGHLLPLSILYLPLRANETVSIKVDLKERNDLSGDIQLAHGAARFTASFGDDHVLKTALGDFESSQGRTSLESVDGLDLMVAFLDTGHETA